MQKGQAHAKKRRTNPILLLVILALVVFLGVELIRVGKRLNEAAQQQAALERQSISHKVRWKHVHIITGTYCPLLLFNLHLIQI